jgi:histidine triad (HIT) family protein
VNPEPANPDACLLCWLVDTGHVTWVAQRSDAVAFAPLQADAIAPGHTLVVPRQHCDGVLTATDTDLTATSLLIREVAVMMQAVLGAAGVCVLNASGPTPGEARSTFTGTSSRAIPGTAMTACRGRPGNHLTTLR